MSYTILRTTDYEGMEEVHLEKEGNKYLVSYRSKGANQWTHKLFDSLYKALDIYELFVEAFALGLYSHEDRKKLLDK